VDSDFRHNIPRFAPENRKANQGLVDLIKQISEQKRVTPAQIALSWLLSRKPWIVPIPGTTQLHRLEENLGAVDVGLTADDLDDIEQALETISVEGDRYNESIQRLIDR
jgi:aryl-alcohol dehydrogenase-like predicted oxidoreductase